MTFSRIINMTLHLPTQNLQVLAAPEIFFCDETLFIHPSLLHQMTSIAYALLTRLSLVLYRRFWTLIGLRFSQPSTIVEVTGETGETAIPGKDVKMWKKCEKKLHLMTTQIERSNFYFFDSDIIWLKEDWCMYTCSV